MFGWFKRKKKQHKPEPVRTEEKKAETVDPGYKDDWAIEHDEWKARWFCHCGQVQDTLPVNGVCPKCGHNDKWEILASRYEWLESASRCSYKQRRDRALSWARFAPSSFYLEFNNLWPQPEPYGKDKKLVRWTPDHCPVNDDAKPTPRRTTTTTKKRKKP